MPNMLSIYLKPTNYCNVGCEHCYLPEETRADKNVMSQATLANTARLVLSLAEKEGQEAAHFIWHGGEPMVLSPSYFWVAQKTLKEVMGDFPYTQSIQTSLIPYRAEWDELIAEVFGGFIGSSVDFTQRHVKNSTDAYLELWLSKVRMARSRGHEIIPGMVPTRYEVPRAKEIYSWFISEGFRAFNVERYSEYGGKTIQWPNNHEHSRFLIDLFDCVMDDLVSKGTAPAINVVIGGITGVLYGQSADRWGTRCQREFLVVEPDGSLNTCPDRARHEPAFSNTADGADAFIQSPSRRKWIKINDITHRESHCHTCEFRAFCRSGCPVTANGPANGQKECSGYKSYLLHVQAYLKNNPDKLERIKQYADMQASELEMGIKFHE